MRIKIAMTEQEGVIKYHLDYTPSAPRDYPEFAELGAWRSILLQLGLIGRMFRVMTDWPSATLVFAWTRRRNLSLPDRKPAD